MRITPHFPWLIHRQKLHSLLGSVKNSVTRVYLAGPPWRGGVNGSPGEGDASLLHLPLNNLCPARNENK